MPEPVPQQTAADVSHRGASTLPVAAARDRVIRAAISRDLIRSTDIGMLWLEYSRVLEGRPQRFWRFVADRQGADREQFYSLAALTYGFSEVEISVSDLIRFLQEVRALFTERQWEKMNELRVIPIGREESGRMDAEDTELRMIFASSDPTRLEVNNCLSTLPIKSFVLRYSPARSVDYALDRVLPVVFSRRKAPAKTSASQPDVRLLPLDTVPSSESDGPGLKRAA